MKVKKYFEIPNIWVDNTFISKLQIESYVSAKKIFRISWKGLGQQIEKSWVDSRPRLISSLKQNLRQDILTQ